jgi:hypothetical protein
MKSPSICALTFALVLAACGDGTKPPVPPGVISLAVGEGRTLTASQAATIEVSGGATGGEFVLIPFHGSQTPTATATLEFSATQVTAVTGPPLPEISPTTTARLSVSPERMASLRARAAARARFDAELRRIERDMLARRLAASAGRSPRASASVAPSGSLAPVPVTGDPMTLNVNAKPQQACSNPDLRTGTVMAVTQFTVIVADNANPGGGFSQADYTAIGQEFDALVQPVVTDNFGLPRDIDTNQGRSVVFYTRAVNEMTPANSDFVIGGFFHPRDLFPKVGPDPNSTEDDCATSNEAEMFYMLVPDPDGTVNGNVRLTADVRQGTVGVLGHEYQHLINASNRIAQNAPPEDVWLNEGLSHVAEELLFYRASGLGPRQNITLSQLVSTPTIRNAVNAYQVDNLARLIDYLEDPEVRSPYTADDALGTRGATWQFLRYAADRNATAERTLWRNLANTRNVGAANVTAVFGGDFLSLVRDWATAQYADDAVAQAPPIYRHPSWNYRSVIPALINQTNPPPFPLTTRTLVAGTPLSLSLKGGGAAYLRFGVASGTTGTITPTSSGAAPPTTVSFTVLRTR